MTDRVPTYPGRVRLVPVSGSSDLYDLIPADEPIENGTPLNKAALLKDSTAALIGIDTLADPTVDDAFNEFMRKINAANDDLDSLFDRFHYRSVSITSENDRNIVFQTKKRPVFFSLTDHYKTSTGGGANYAAQAVGTIASDLNAAYSVVVPDEGDQQLFKCDIVENQNGFETTFRSFYGVIPSMIFHYCSIFLVTE